MRRLSIALAILLLGMSSGCRRTVSGGLTLAGSTSLQPLAEAWVDAYHRRHAGVRITVQGGGSTAGVHAALAGAAQIGMASRLLTAQEARRARAVTVARDGIVLIAHPRNVVSSVTLAQARALYNGRLSTWSDVGGSPRRVTLITREEGSGTRAAFEAMVMSGQPIAGGALVSDSTGAVSQMVAGDPDALGYISVGLLNPSVKALALDGVSANEGNIDAGRYPLVRPFLFVVAPSAGRGASEFIAWVTGPEGRTITRREGMLPPVEGVLDAPP